ncbi:hypothetical protein DL764_007893 [Monosporascus ibericus]|uniref:DUF7924 domain-containing protein n=1 Tax=Monosporascus ibericus TaxID=155417 RepID=A0A4Q4SYW5_9PEZI|nr:hypothetical protein DL764_007893 [Monosporascus ibericus]
MQLDIEADTSALDVALHSSPSPSGSAIATERGSPTPPDVAEALNSWLTDAGFRNRTHKQHLHKLTTSSLTSILVAMARTRAQTAAQKGLPSPAPKDILPLTAAGKRPQGIQSRKGAPRKRGRFEEQHATKRTRRNRLRPPTISETPSRQDLPAPVQSRGRKRKQSIEDALEPSPDPDQKRQRTSRTHAAENTFNEPAVCSDTPKQTDPIAFWTKEGRWPEEQCWPEETWETNPTMEHLLARKKSSSNLSRKRSNSATSTTPSDQKPREEKSALYRDQRYETLLEVKGSYMTKAPLGLAGASQVICRSLLEKAQPIPSDTLFRDDIFEATCQKIHNRNEARVIQDITRLIVPSAESLDTFGAEHLDILTESVNEGWNNSIPLTSTRPQPDYSVGFRREAFTDDQLAKLSPFIGNFIAGDQSLFMATYYMYFPFLTYEVKCGAAALDVADRQNAHSITLTVRAVAELFRTVKREDEIHRQILGFSISHDHRSVRIYGHYPVIDGKDTKYYRHPIHTFDFTALDGRKKWTAYRFTKNVYDVWMPTHFKMICSAIDQLPSDLDFDVASFPETGLSQNLKSHHLSRSDAGSVSLSIKQDSRSNNTGVEKGTPGTSFTDLGAKRRKGKN